uniref:Cysteine-rich DPF motif domain-containing protein 1 n=1 Tax=Corvus moneduloides TaxID=1196302 RepID=A0A8U7M426_CORMO
DCSHVLCHLREFKCELCELSALYTYYGQMPPNSHSIVLLEEDKFLIVGSHRSLCSRAVCVGTVSNKVLSPSLGKGCVPVPSLLLGAPVVSCHPGHNVQLALGACTPSYLHWEYFSTSYL